jgi:hypothetical protein
MPYDLFPSVDENFNFPEEVRVQLAKSEQLRNLLIPMSETVRDSLSGDELWFGRTIFNTTSKKIESWTDPGVWVGYLDDTYDFPEPPPFWDENYDVPTQVRSRLAKSEQLRNMITPMTETARNSLPVEEKWNGRTIFNTTSKKVQFWLEAAQNWLSVLDEDYVPVQPSWRDWEPLLKYYGKAYVPQNFTAYGRAITTDSVTTYMFVIVFSGDIAADPCPVESLVIPVERSAVRFTDENIMVGNIFLDYRSAGGGLRSGVAKFNDENRGWPYDSIYPFGSLHLYFNGPGTYNPLKANSPQLFTNGCKIYGQVSYESDPLMNNNY